MKVILLQLNDNVLTGVLYNRAQHQFITDDRCFTHDVSNVQHHRHRLVCGCGYKGVQWAIAHNSVDLQQMWVSLGKYVKELDSVNWLKPEWLTLLEQTPNVLIQLPYHRERRRHERSYR